jgi:hypothetical protein
MGRVDQQGRLHVYVLTELPPGEYEVTVELLASEAALDGAIYFRPSYSFKYIDPGLVCNRSLTKLRPQPEP